MGGPGESGEATLQVLRRALALPGVEGRLLRLCLCLKFLESFAYYALNQIFALYLTEEFGASDSLSGVVFGLRGALSVLYASILGPLVDSWGVAPCLRVAFMLTAIGRLGFACVTGWRLLIFLICGPLAIGHSLTAPVLAIGVKRALAQAEGSSTLSELDVPSRDAAGAPPPSVCYGLLYWATVLGIFFCGPMVDLCTTSTQAQGLARLSGSGYRSVAFFSALLSLLGFLGALLIPTVSSHAKTDAEASTEVQPLTSRSLKQVVCTPRFLRFCMFCILVLPGNSVIRNLDGGIFPKFMVRTFGADVPKGTIYAINPLLDLVLVPLVSAWTQERQHFSMIRWGLLLASISPVAVTFFGPTALGVGMFILLLTLGDILYNPRMDAYAMEVAPDGYEGTFSGASSAVLFLADMPTGLVGGLLLEHSCPADQPCKGRELFGLLAAFAFATPIFMFACPACIDATRETVPSVPSFGGDAWVAELEMQEKSRLEEDEPMIPSNTRDSETSVIGRPVPG